MIGVDDQVKFQSEIYDIKDKTELFIYTDGAYESTLPDGNMMNVDDLVDFLSTNLNSNDDEIEKLYDYLVDLNSGEGLNDDFTIMKISFTQDA